MLVRRLLPIACMSIMVGLCMTAVPAQPDLFRMAESFGSSPFIGNGGSWSVEGGGLTSGQFLYDAQTHSLVTHVDSRLATTKLVRPLPRTLSGTDSFEFGALLRIDSNGFHASPYGFFEIAFGLINSQTTGTDRVGVGSGNDDTYDALEWDFYPNVSPIFGGPSVGPTAIGGRSGSAWYDNFAFDFGPSTDLHNEIAAGLLPPTGLPLDTPLKIRLRYDAADQTVALDIRAFEDGQWQTLPINVPPLDASGLDPSFIVDQIAISLYNDPMNPSQQDPSLTATVRYSEIYVQSLASEQTWTTRPKTAAPIVDGLIAVPK